MSARCVLVAGPGGTGCSTQAAELATSYAASGRSVVLLGAEPFDDATSMLQPQEGGLLRILSPADGAVHSDHPIGQLLGAVGLEPRLSSEMAQLPEAATFRLLWQLASVAGSATSADGSDSPNDSPRGAATVVVDAGRRAVELVRLATALPWLLQRIAPAQRGWLSTSRPLLAAALGTRWPGDALTDQVHTGLVQATAASRMLLGPGSASVVCAGSAPPMKVRRVIAGLALGAAPVTATIGGIRPGPCDPPRWASDCSAHDQRMYLDRYARTGRSGGMSCERDGTDYLWRMPLYGVHFRELSLSMVQDDLVLEALGHRSVMPMPTVLRRCRPVGADLRQMVLTVRFSSVGQDGSRDDRG